MYFIPKEEVTFATKKVTYPKIVCNIRPNKAETHRKSITVGGNLLEYEVTLTTPNATITTDLFCSTVLCQPQKQSVYWQILKNSTSTTIYLIQNI